MNTKARCFFAVLALLSLLCCALTSATVYAIEVDDLYQASVPVSDQSRQARGVSQKQALEQVLVKVSGTNEVLENAEVTQAIKNAGSYLRRFQFIRNDNNELMLLADFDEAKINKLLRNEGLPIWGKRRPSILLWLAGEDPQSGIRHVVSKESYAEVASKLMQHSQNRGLPMVLPLYDIVDNQKVLVSDVWGYFYDHIRKFSLRYKTDAIVIGRFRQYVESGEPSADQVEQAMQWQLQWRLYESDNIAKNSVHDGSLDDVLQQLVNDIANRFAQQYAVDASKVEGGNRLILTISNVGEIENLINAENLLLSFSAVSDVMLKSFQHDSAEFEVMLLGESLDLLQGLDLEKRFVKVFDPLADPQSQPLIYRWVP